jgi:hypothetical protein
MVPSGCLLLKRLPVLIPRKAVAKFRGMHNPEEPVPSPFVRRAYLTSNESLDLGQLVGPKAMLKSKDSLPGRTTAGQG